MHPWLGHHTSSDHHTAATTMTRPVNNMQHERHPAPPSCLLLKEYALLFYMGKFMGITSYDYQEFRKHKRLKKSPGGDCFVIITMIIVFINFNLMVGIFENTSFLEEKRILAVIIGFLLTYFSLFTYLVDRIVYLRKQDKLIEIFESLQDLEDDFMALDLGVCNAFIRLRLTLALIFVFTIEAVIFWGTFMFVLDRSGWTAWLWLFSAAPTLGNSLDKMWYTSLVLVIRNRFGIINQEFQRITMNLERKKQKNFNVFTLSTLRSIMMTLPTISKTKVTPMELKVMDNFDSTASSRLSTGIESAFRNVEIPFASSIKTLEERFSKLCQLHDGLCVVAMDVNSLWAFQNLIGMGYGFFIIIAQLYFLYCSDQLIPALFRPTDSWIITSINVTYIALKCFRIVYCNWTATLEAKKTGICMHRYAVAADSNEVYELINHLSLKFFNHIINFNACGYFNLEMSTMFAFCGGITTYLIILIQFNIEGQQQAKSISNGSVQTGLLGSDLAAEIIQQNITNLYDHIVNNIMGN